MPAPNGGFSTRGLFTLLDPLDKLIFKIIAPQNQIVSVCFLELDLKK